MGVKNREVFGLDWRSSLGDYGLGVNVSILLNGRDAGERPQELYVSIDEVSSETVDDVPFVCDRGLVADLVGEGGDADSTINAVAESHNITSANRVLIPPDQDEGRGSSKSWGDAENDGD